MTIVIDSSELRTTSKMPNISNAVKSDILEEFTGADFMITVATFPATSETLIRKHIEQGALLVQRKHGLDLPSSVGVRLNSSLAKMQAAGAKFHQCILLFIGLMTVDKEGIATINNQQTMPFFHIQAAISKWHDRGGVYENLPRATLIEDWCKMKMRHLREYANYPTKQVFPLMDSVHGMDEFTQTLQLINDGRKTLVTLPGIGVKGANKLWEKFDGNLGEIIAWLTMLNTSKDYVKGFGPKTFEKIRAYFDLQDIFELRTEVGTFVGDGDK